MKFEYATMIIGGISYPVTNVVIEIYKPIFYELDFLDIYAGMMVDSIGDEIDA